MSKFRAIAVLTAAICATQPSIAAAPNVAIDSAVYVERVSDDLTRSLEPASRLNRGDRVVTVVNWYRLGGQGGFTVTNPLPRHLYFQGSARADEEVSIDGGKTWGKLEGMRVGDRIATPEDVTHVRWHIAPALAARGSGRIAYSAIVR